jgi:hypothetical protein
VPEDEASDKVDGIVPSLRLVGKTLLSPPYHPTSSAIAKRNGVPANIALENTLAKWNAFREYEENIDLHLCMWL